MRRAYILLVAIGLLVLLGGCQDDPTGLDESGNSPVMYGNKSAPDPAHMALLDSLKYEEVFGSITPNLGGFIMIEMQTWPGGCTFAINIPPGSLPDDDNNNVPFSLRIPTYQSYMEHADYDKGKGLPMIIRLEPSGLNFLKPLTVWGTYMPWAVVDLSKPFDYWTVSPEYEDFGHVPSVHRDKKWVRFNFEAPHFSDWEVRGPKPD